MGVPLPPKKEVALALLERSSVHLHLDPRAPGVVVPAGFKKLPQLVLQIGLNMPVPIPDLRLDEEGMSCTLSFNRAPFFCVVPWGSVYAMVGDDGRGMVWPDDVPPEVEQQARGREGETAGSKKLAVKRAPDPDARGRPMAAVADARGQRATPEEGPQRPARAAREAGVPKAKKPRKRAHPGAEAAVASNGVQATESPASSPPRATLVAVPPIVSKKESPPPQPLAQKAPKVDVGRPAPRIVSGERRPNSAPRAKRELPPYLRVVK
jgi:stringent starvation protein B